MPEKKIRVHHIAKELQVPSKVIIEKCRAEGIEVKNHMHVLSAGLQATVREWFSEGAHLTTLEESKRVDLKAVRKKKAKKKTAASKGPDVAVATAGETATAVAPPPPPSEVVVLTEVPAGPVPVVEPTIAPFEPEMPGDVRPAAAVGTPVEPGVAVEPATPAEPVAEAPVAPTAEAPTGEAVAATESQPLDGDEKTDAGEPEAPLAPKPIAGPQNIPIPAKLSGPKVVRMDRPERVDIPRPSPRPSFRQRSTADSQGGPPSTFGGRTGVAPPPGQTGRGRTGRGGPDQSDARRGPGRKGGATTKTRADEKVKEWRDRDLIERRDRLARASGRGIGHLRAMEGRQAARRSSKRTAQPHVMKDKAELAEPIFIKDMSCETGIQANVIVKALMQEGILAGLTTQIDAEHAELICTEHGIELTVIKAKSGLDKLAEEFDALPRKKMKVRSPVVTVLGHVDHGKTSLLDRIRKANVAGGEAGGITQHVGAYRVRVGDNWVTFLDTPGHAAFTEMRARGANMTDVVVLVVAADDGVMPTTVEAINHAKAAGATIVVALNKIDLSHDINKIYGQLTEHDLTPAGDWGGQTDIVETSALTGQGIDDLLAHLATLSEVMDLQADPTIPATGAVIESELSGSLGNVARVLVQEGTLKTGDVIVCGAAYGRVRSLTDDHGRKIKKAGPSVPVEVTGLNGVPFSGDRFFAVSDLKKAKDIAEEVAAQRRESELSRLAKPTSLESMLANAAAGDIPELNVIIRADVQGSVDVLRQALSEYPDDEVKLVVMHAGVGTVTQSDISLAKASSAIIVSFHVLPDPTIQRLADSEGVEIRTYRVIYEVISDIQKALEGLLTPDEKIESRGRAEVREIFSVSKIGKIAGCFVRDGSIKRSHMVRVIRDGVLVKDSGEIDSLRRFKDDAKEVKSGFECGIRVMNFDDLKVGDVIEAFEIVKVARTLQV